MINFFLFAQYQFEVQGKTYQGETQWDQAFLNEWTAKEAIGRLNDLRRLFGTMFVPSASFHIRYTISVQRESLLCFIGDSFSLFSWPGSKRSQYVSMNRSKIIHCQFKVESASR